MFSKVVTGFVLNRRYMFLSHRTPIKKVPVVGGEPVDMYKLYTQVVQMGGFTKVDTLCL